MFGTIIGDIVGSVYERHNIKITTFPLFIKESRFTDDTAMTIATADAILNQRDYGAAYHDWGNRYLRVGYGKTFKTWLASSNPQPYNSWGNGSAMRVSPVGWAFDTLEEVLKQAELTALPTHNHPEGIKGAQAVAAAVFMARLGKNKEEIKQYIADTFGYDLNRKVADFSPTYTFDVSCQGSVPEAIIAFLEGEDYENTVRIAVSIGGDSDTIAAIAGGIAEAFYKKIPAAIVAEAKTRLPRDIQEVITSFNQKFIDF